MKWQLIVILIWISLMTSDNEYFFMCFLAIYIALKKCLFKCFAHFLMGCLSFCCWVIIAHCIYWILDPYQIYGLKIFLCSSVGCLFIFLIIAFAAWEILISEVQFIYFLLLLLLVPNPRSWRFTTIFSSKIFVVLVLILELLIYFEFIFVYGVK